MAADASIYGQIQQPKIASPFELEGQVQNLVAGRNQNRLADLQMQKAAKAEADDALLRDTYKQFGADPTANTNKLYQMGLGAQAQSYSKSQADIAKERAAAQASQIDTQRKVNGMLGSTAYALMQNPNVTKQEVLAAADRLKAQLPPEFASQMNLDNVPDDPAQLRQALERMYTGAVETEKLIADATSRRNNDETNKTSRDNNTATNQTSRLNNTDTNATSRSNNAATNATTRRGQDFTNERGVEANSIARTKAGAAGPDGRPSKPMPATALKMQNEALDVIGIASSIQADLGTIEQQLNKGKLDFGPVKNVANNLKNMAGMSDEQSRNFSTFKSSMEKLRNDSLRLNKGVQTDGDAQRAWNELFQNINDKDLVKQRLAEIKAINSRAVDLRKREVEDIRNNYNQQQYDFSGQTNVPSAITPPSGGANIDALLEKYK